MEHPDRLILTEDIFIHCPLSLSIKEAFGSCINQTSKVIFRYKMATRIRQDLERAHHLMKCRSVKEDGSDYSRSLIERTRREDHRLWLRSEARRSLELCPRTDTRFHRPRWLACVQGDRKDHTAQQQHFNFIAPVESKKIWRTIGKSGKLASQQTFGVAEAVILFKVFRS